MDDLNKRLRALSAHEHDDLFIGGEAADALTRGGRRWRARLSGTTVRSLICGRRANGTRTASGAKALTEALAMSGCIKAGMTATGRSWNLCRTQPTGNPSRPHRRTCDGELLSVRSVCRWSAFDVNSARPWRTVKRKPKRRSPIVADLRKRYDRKKEKDGGLQ